MPTHLMRQVPWLQIALQDQPLVASSHYLVFKVSFIFHIAYLPSLSIQNDGLTTS